MANMIGHSVGWQKAVVGAAARRAGISPALLWGIYGAETSFGTAPDTNARNYAGAKGPFQLTPDTARSLGVLGREDDFVAAANAAAHYLAQFKAHGTRNMLIAYNGGPGRIGLSDTQLPAETRNYIPTVLRYARQYGAGAPGITAPAPGPGGGAPASSAPAGIAVTPASSSAIAAALQAAAQASRPQISTVPLTPPRFAASPTMPRGYAAVQTGGVTSPTGSSGGLADALAQIANAGGGIQVTGGGAAPPGSPGASSSTGLPRGGVRFAPGADRAGVPTSRKVKAFLGLVAGQIGQPITVTTGSNHNRMTVDGNVSDHWTGNAADIGVPIDSVQGDMIAGRALMLLGVPRLQARAMAQRGGLYTITPRTGALAGHRVQVIWKTYQGGDHHNHVHVGIA